MKNWKDHFLRSGVPLEYEVGLALAKAGMDVDADFGFLRRDVRGEKEWSVDIAARWFGPTENNISFTLEALVECKYRSPDKTIILLEDPNERNAPGTLGCTVSSFDAFVPYELSTEAFVHLEEKLPFVYKCIEIHDRGAVEEDIRHGIQQLRFATPVLLCRSLDFNMSNNREDRMATFLTKLLVTNAPLRILHRGIGIDAIRGAQRIEDISDTVEVAILFSDYGPDFEDHFRSVFKDRATERMETAKSVTQDLVSSKDRTPSHLIANLSAANRFECYHIATQFFIVTLAAVPALIKSIKQTCKKAYRDRARISP